MFCHVCACVCVCVGVRAGNIMYDAHLRIETRPNRSFFCADTSSFVVQTLHI